MTALDDRLSAIEQKLDEILDRLDRMEGIKKEVITIKEAADLLGVSSYTVQKYKVYWIEGVHYFPQDKGDRYNRFLLEDWQQNRHNPSAHQIAIDLWLSKQAQNQRKRKK